MSIQTRNTLRRELGEAAWEIPEQKRELLVATYARRIKEDYTKTVPLIPRPKHYLPGGLVIQGYTKDGSAVYNTTPSKRNLNTAPDPDHYRVDTEYDGILKNVDMDELLSFKDEFEQVYEGIIFYERY